MSSAGWSAVTTSSSVRWPCCGSVWSSRSEAKASPRSRSATWSEQKLTPTSETPRCRGRWSCSSRCMESTEEEETTEEEEERVFEDRRNEKDGVCGRRRWSRQEISRPSKASNPEGNQLGREIKRLLSDPEDNQKKTDGFIQVASGWVSRRWEECLKQLRTSVSFLTCAENFWKDAVGFVLAAAGGDSQCLSALCKTITKLCLLGSLRSGINQHKLSEHAGNSKLVQTTRL